MAKNGSPERVPVEFPCPLCRGTGTLGIPPKRVICSRCGGSGRVWF